MMMAAAAEGASESGCPRTWDDAISAMAFDNAQQFADFLARLDKPQQTMVLDAIDQWLACQR